MMHKLLQCAERKRRRTRNCLEANRLHDDFTLQNGCGRRNFTSSDGLPLVVEVPTPRFPLQCNRRTPIRQLTFID